MNCELAREDIVLSVYGELPDDRVHRLEQHLAQCERCRQEMEAVSALQKAMTALPIAEPSPVFSPAPGFVSMKLLMRSPRAAFFGA